MSDLRETLATRLWIISLGAAAPKVLTHTPNHFVMEGWRALADECIRQMGWARHNALIERDWNAIMRQAALDDDLSMPLTPAPDGWSPPK
jgi:hypothetical protein